MPRMHEFNHPSGRVWIDLDQIATVCEGPDGLTLLTVNGYRQMVEMPMEEVIRLIDPPAAPDRFEEHIRRMKDRHAEGIEDRPMTAEPEAGPTCQVDDGLDAVSIARLEELATITDLLARLPDEGRAVKHVLLHIAQRIMAI